VNDEVSVAELLVRDGWGEYAPPPARSRWRVVAVMVAVVIGCGTAAVLVAFSGPPRQNAQQVDQIRVLPMPDRTTGGPNTTSADPSGPPSNGGVGGGTPGPTAGGTRPGRPAAGGAPHSQSPTSTVELPTSAVPTGTTVPREDPPTSGTGTTQPPPPPPPTTTEPRGPCWLGILFC
jgi:hypothetical protein